MAHWRRVETSRDESLESLTICVGNSIYVSEILINLPARRVSLGVSLSHTQLLLPFRQPQPSLPPSLFVSRCLYINYQSLNVPQIESHLDFTRSCSWVLFSKGFSSCCCSWERVRCMWGRGHGTFSSADTHQSESGNDLRGVERPLISYAQWRIRTNFRAIS